MIKVFKYRAIYKRTKFLTAEIFFTLQELTNRKVPRSLIEKIKAGYIPDRYTDKKDKNGTQIYEGDIVKLTAYNQKFISDVVWCEYGWELNSKNIPEEEYLPLSGFEDSEFEVIANIYQNQELVRV